MVVKTALKSLLFFQDLKVGHFQEVKLYNICALGDYVVRKRWALDSPGMRAKCSSSNFSKQIILFVQ